MTLYRILDVTAKATDEEIVRAAAECRSVLRKRCPPAMLDASISYIDKAESILVSVEGRECYESIVGAHDSCISPLRAFLILKRIYWFNFMSGVHYVGISGMVSLLVTKWTCSHSWRHVLKISSRSEAHFKRTWASGRSGFGISS